MHVLASETGMPVARLFRLVEQDNKLYVLVRWKGFSDANDTLELVTRVYEDVPQLLLKLLRRKATGAQLRAKSCFELGVEEGKCNDPQDRRPSSTKSSPATVSL